MDPASPAPDPVEEAIFHAASDLNEPAVRAAFLDRACGLDRALRARIETLLAAELRARQFLAEDPLDLDAKERPKPAMPPGEQSAGDQIGRYKLLEKIGEGGMGIVYMAEQREPVVRKVALKIIKPGMDTRQVVARFEAERQALALMDHPNIARVLDGGVTDNSRPYFVMDLVQGIPITQFCDERNLSTMARLDLFLEVCSAIQHAHQKGIIHRDIKPTNILVTLHGDKPVPKVIDFGVAKATQQRLTDKTLFTQFQHFIGTPAYMSPEQASLSGLDIDTRSDIYGLGVLLYELLTGKTPFDARELVEAGLDEMRRTIREVEPVKPSTRLTRERVARSAASGKSEIRNPKSEIDQDLDWIVMKCLEKDRNRRYETTDGLAADIQRHLSNEPITARPPSRLYEFRKTVRRHKMGFAAATAVLLVLAAGVAVSSWQAVRARRAEHQQAHLREQAQRAEGQKTEELGKSLLAFARASRQSGEPGRRFASMEAITKAAAIHKPRELRNEAIAALALTDLGQPQVWRAAVFMRDGYFNFDLELERYAVGRPDKAISICRVSDQQELFRIPPAETEGRMLLFSPNGKWLAVRHDDGALRVWDLERHGKTVEVQLDGNLHWSLDYSPDSQWVVAGSMNNLVRCFEVATGAETNSFQLSVAPAHLLFDPVGKVLAIHDGQRCALWDWEQRRLRRTFALPPRASDSPTPERPLTAWAWHPDGVRFATGSDDEDIYLWDTRTGRHQVLHQPNRLAARLIFSPRGDLLLSYGWDSTTRVWDAQTGQPLLSSEGGYAWQFSRDSQRLAFFRDNGELGIWPVVSSKVFRNLNTRVPLRWVLGGCDFSPDGRFLVWGQDDGLRWLDMISGEVEFQELASARVWGFHPDRKSLFTSSTKGLFNWPVTRESNAGDERLRLGTPTRVSTPANPFLRRFAISGDGKTMVVGATNQWSVIESGGLERVMKYPTSLEGDNHFFLSPDKRWVGLGFWNASAFVCDARSGEPVKEFPDVRAGIMAFTPDGRWLVTCGPKEYRFWETGTWRPGLVIKRELASSASGAIAFGLEGRVMAIARTAHLVQLLNPNSGEVLADLTAPTPIEIHKLRFSPDGGVLAVTGMQGIHLWDLRELRRELARLNLDWDHPPYPPSTFSFARTLFHARNESQ